MRFLIIGPPGAGKGTIASFLKEIYHIPHLSTGELFRKEITEQTSLGTLAGSFLSRGELVPDNITINLVKQKFRGSEYENGFLLDGFPRTIPQAVALDKILTEYGWHLDLVINIVADGEVLINRISGRRVCSHCGELYHIENKRPKIKNICDNCGGPLLQRPDDVREITARRIEVYRNQTKPLLEYYDKQNLLVNINGNETIEENILEMRNILSRRIK